MFSCEFVDRLFPRKESIHEITRTRTKRIFTTFGLTLLFLFCGGAFSQRTTPSFERRMQGLEKFGAKFVLLLVPGSQLIFHLLTHGRFDLSPLYRVMQRQMLVLPN